MAKIAPFGRYRAFSNNGAPLNGGKLYTYIAGTTTFKTTYKDSAGAAANTNPVILDANGYADVWLDVGGYKFILRDANDNLLWTVDNIDGGGSTGYASTVISKSAGFNLSVNEKNAVIVCTQPLTASLLPTATAGDGFSAILINRSTGNVTIDPDGSETINGGATFVVSPGASAAIHTDGTAWYVSGNAPVQFDDTLFRIIGSVTPSKMLAFEVDGLTAATTRTVAVQDVSGTMVVTGGLDLPIADGGTGQSTAALGFDALKQASTDTYTGVVELATTAELKTGSDAVRAVTPAAILAAMGHSSFAVTANTAITSGMSLTLAHGFGRVPLDSWVEIVNVTPELGYTAGQVVKIPPYGYQGANLGYSTRADGTNVVMQLGSSGAPISILTTAGVNSGITLANWNIRLKAIG